MTSLSLALPLKSPTAGGDRSIDERALEAQGELLPYALAFFAIALPVFVWAGAYAADAAWMSAIFVQFGLNWAAFYAVVNLIGRKDGTSIPTSRRMALHVGAAKKMQATAAAVSMPRITSWTEPALAPNTAISAMVSDQRRPAPTCKAIRREVGIDVPSLRPMRLTTA